MLELGMHYERVLQKCPKYLGIQVLMGIGCPSLLSGFVFSISICPWELEMNSCKPRLFFM